MVAPRGGAAVSCIACGLDAAVLANERIPGSVDFVPTGRLMPVYICAACTQAANAAWARNTKSLGVSPKKPSPPKKGA